MVRERDAAMPLNHETFRGGGLAVAERGRSHGNHPFGAIVVSGTGEILLEAENGYMPDRDMTGHAERLLATAASKQFDPKFLAGCTLYTSAEPCCMCAGAAYWAGIGRVVYGLSERRLKTITGNHAANPTRDLPCPPAIAAGQPPVEGDEPPPAGEAA